VRTTGVYCRPACPARRALRANVCFHASCDAAEAAGFRPCKRCRPRELSLGKAQAEMVARACRQIAAAAEPPGLDALARAAGMSRFHFHRIFKAITGVTPRAYAVAERAERVRAALPASGSVTDAIYRAGFNSSSRFYAQAGATLGMPPSRYRKGGGGMAIRYAMGESTLGLVLVAATAAGICAIALGDEQEALLGELRGRFPKAELIEGDTQFGHSLEQVLHFVDAPAANLDLPLDVQGTVFQHRVWEALREVPPGRTVSYSELARRVGAERAVRAVAHACASNPVAIAIPCHRAVRSDGGLAGYRWGIERKRDLLARERNKRRK
jgi:AraC family transcriptional regulator of adaptative response/methylated-DNA-[protein]-cysteine methyltransferase